MGLKKKKKKKKKKGINSIDCLPIIRPKQCKRKKA